MANTTDQRAGKTPATAKLASAALLGCYALICHGLPAITPAHAAEPDAVPALENKHLRLAFDPAHGAITQLLDKDTAHEFSDKTTGPDRRCWQLEALSDKTLTIGPEQAQSFKWNAHGGRLTLTWEDFGLAAAPNLRIAATVRLNDDEPASRWRMTVQNATGLALTAARFPRLPGITPQDQESLAVPVWMGERTDRPRAILGRGRRQWDYPGPLSLQCITLYRPNGPGLTFACQDGKMRRKAFAVFRTGAKGLGMECVHYPETSSDAPGQWTLDYDVALSTFRGDWFNAAQRYRRWATRQPWARKSRLAQGLVPEWITDTGLWVWNRGRSENVLAPAAYVQEKAQLPVSVFWHWWHHCPYDVGFPEYFPPREGAEPFRKAVANAQGKGIHALVYMNQRLWGVTTQSWKTENAEAFAVRDRAGKIRTEVYNTFTKAPCAPMCIGTAFWRNKYASLAEKAMVELGVAGIYMDQACLSLTCHAPTHGHAPGGDFWTDGFRALVEDIRKRCARRAPIALAGEGCGEPWLAHLDLMLSLQVSMERYATPGQWEPIPFFHAVYHPYAVFYGNYASLTMPPYDELWPAEFAPAEPLQLLDRKFSRQFRLEHARAFVWGQQPTLANIRAEHFQQRPEEIDYVLRLARLRRRALPYLLHGTFLRPPKLDVPDDDLDMSRLSIYAGRQGALKEFKKRFPLVLAGAWQAPDGDIAVALANIADRPISFPLALAAPAYPLPAQGQIRLMDDTGDHPAGRFARSAVNLDANLPPRAARIYTFTPANR
ncbi:MAG: hypothetical protein JXQ73_11510 [Phycisphaerae bacterium]|nr:hypothetical protein [Phycisphaerae bacterium]